MDFAYPPVGKTGTFDSSSDNRMCQLSVNYTVKGIWRQHFCQRRQCPKLDRITRYYQVVGLLGCVGPMDVVHIKWSNCTAGDHNRAKEKECYTTLWLPMYFRLQLTDPWNLWSGPMFRAQNDKDFVKLDPKVNKIWHGWFNHIWWQYYHENG